MATTRGSTSSKGSAIAKAGVGAVILVGLLVTTDDQGFRESILIAMATGVVYGFYRIVYKRAAVRWWKAWVANFIAVIGLGVFAVLGGATAEVVAEMIGLIAIPGAIAAACLVPLSRAFAGGERIE